MCNACGFYCCASDEFDGCGCDCPEAICREMRCPMCFTTFDLGIDEACPCEDDFCLRRTT